jgi:hypothetical protein
VGAGVDRVLGVVRAWELPVPRGGECHRTPVWPAAGDPDGDSGLLHRTGSNSPLQNAASRLNPSSSLRARSPRLHDLAVGLELVVVGAQADPAASQ